jgi:hypothetical protein
MTHETRKSRCPSEDAVTGTISVIGLLVVLTVLIAGILFVF